MSTGSSEFFTSWQASGPRVLLAAGCELSPLLCRSAVCRSAATRKHGVPEVLVSDNGGVFRSHDAMRIYDALGIQKVEIEKQQAWRSYIESILHRFWLKPPGMASYTVLIYSQR